MDAIERVYTKMQDAQLEGRPLISWVGGGNGLAVATQMVKRLESYAGLSPADTVLDIGCGCGRIAALLTQGRVRSYTGVDLVPGLVNFAEREIAPLNQAFRFFVLQGSDTRATWDVSKSEVPVIPDLAEAYNPDSVNLVLAISMFTHITPTIYRAYLKHIASALTETGRVYATFFLLDRITRQVIGRAKPALTFQSIYEEDGFYVEDLKRPWHAVGISFEKLRELAADAGLYIERALFGTWPGRPIGMDFQDTVILRRIF